MLRSSGISMKVVGWCRPSLGQRMTTARLG
jgi:hypothetical protein